MRAICIPGIEIGNEPIIKITDEAHHHLKNVLRLTENTPLLILDGNGLKARGVIESLDKKITNIKIESKEVVENQAQIDVFVAQVKKDAMDLVFKQACELNIRNLLIGETSYSQRYTINQKRLTSLLTTALEQSNNLYFPQIQMGVKLEEVKKYKNIIFFDSVNSHLGLEINSIENTLLVLGPEGGFSDEEAAYLAQLENAKGIHLNTAILRTSTALPCATGYVLGAVSQK